LLDFMSVNELADHKAVRQPVWWFAGLLLAALLVGRAQFRFAIVVGDSMRPTTKTGDLLLINRRAYRDVEPKRGDVVLAQLDRDIIVKRVIGLPGEEVAVDHGRIYINGKRYIEPNDVQPGPLEISSGRLLQGKFALLGDNRSLGAYETVHAIVSKQRILGRVVWSLHRGLTW
jgi:signal peptidase I